MGWGVIAALAPKVKITLCEGRQPVQSGNSKTAAEQRHSAQSGCRHRRKADGRCWESALTLPAYRAGSNTVAAAATPQIRVSAKAVDLSRGAGSASVRSHIICREPQLVRLVQSC